MISRLLAGTAAILLAATSLHADPGGGKGGGPGAEQGRGGPGKGGPGKLGGAEKRGGPGKGDERRAERGGPPPGNDGRDAKGRDDRMQGPARAAEKARGPDRDRERDPQRSAYREDRGPDRRGPEPRGTERFGEFEKGDARRIAERRDDRRWRDENRGPGSERFRWASLDRRDVVEGCPPGLARKNNGCVPPGLARVRDDDWYDAYDRPDWWGLDGYQGRYRYSDGRLLQIGDAGSVLGYLPLLGGALAPGNLWPSTYEPVAVPDYYHSYYNLGTQDEFRYYDDAFYTVDPQTQAISAIAALLTGDDFAVGEPMPEGYDIYNVPYGYRDQYVDGPDAEYRYADGYVYEVDPTTQLIRTAIELLT